MKRTIKVTGVSDELVSLLDAKIREVHAAGRAEYVRELIRKDVLQKKRPFYETASPQERAKDFMEWTRSLQHLRLPHLPDKALSRESLYGKQRA